MFVQVHRNKIHFERCINLQLEQQKFAVEAKNHEILAAQQQLVQSEKMASLGTLTAGVAHEINNPTNYAYTAVFMMKNEITEIKSFLKQLAGGDNADVEVIKSFDDKFSKLVELTKTATEGTTRIKTIVEDLRTFSRLDEAKEAQVHISELIKSTVHLVNTQYDAITIKTKLDYDPLLTCFPSKLNQVLMNLIVNACQAVEARKEHSPELEEQKLENQELAGKITISSSQLDDKLIINVKDNGCGMDEATQEKIFEPFFTTKDVGSGTGLGLAISFGIIEDHGGTLSAISVVGEGATLSICLPVKSTDIS
jgi:signal transduction histidine kinase